MKRVAAHKVTFRGMTYTMSVVELSDDGITANVFPLQCELPSTIFYPGHIKVEIQRGNLVVTEP